MLYELPPSKPCVLLQDFDSELVLAAIGLEPCRERPNSSNHSSPRLHASERISDGVYEELLHRCIAGEQHFLLVGEVPKERSCRHTRLGRDLLHSRRIETLGCEELKGSFT